MPLRIWMPSCAAGPLNTAAWPRTMRSRVTPFSASAKRGNKAAAVARMSAVRIFTSVSNAKKFGMAYQLRYIQLLPLAAGIVVVFRAQPPLAARRRLARAQLRGIAQPERAIDEQRRGAAKALAEDYKARLLACGGGPDAEESGEIDHAVQVAAHVGHTPEPGVRQRHRGNGRDRDNLAGLG